MSVATGDKLPRTPGIPPVGRRLVARLVAIGGGQAAATAVIALLVDRLFAAAAASTPIPAYGIGLLAFFVAAITFLRYRERVDGERLGQTAAHHIRQALIAHLVKLPAVTGTGSAGAVVLRFTSDLTAFQNWYARGLVTLLVATPMIVAGLGMIAWLDWRIALALAFGLLAVAAGQALLSPRLRNVAREARRHRGRLASDVGERVDALASVQMFGRSQAEARRLERRSQALADAMIERARWSGRLRGSVEWLAAGFPLLLLGVWWTGGPVSLSTAGSTMTVGALLAVRIRELGRVLEYWTLARVSHERIAAFLQRDVLDQRSDRRRAHRRDGQLKLKQLGIVGVFSKLDLKAPPGARIALTGPNGAGKSRLLRLIAGLEEPSSGSIVIDGQDMARRQLSSRRKLVALASTDTPMLRGTVEQNIWYGARVDDDEADSILAHAGYDALAAELPDGIGTRVGPGGRGLSLGQQRRVMLMRALMRRPLVLLLDEIESGLDAAGQALLLRVFEQFDGSIVMATHSAEWQRRCDTTWALPGTETADDERSVREVGHG